MTTSTPAASSREIGKLAREVCQQDLSLRVLRSAAGYYIGTCDEDGMPCSRESVEYFRKEVDADQALRGGRWTQRSSP